MENRIFNEDCRVGLCKLPDNSVDCCVTSPPYFGLRDYGVSKQIGLEETPEKYIKQLVKVFREIKRILKPQGTLWVIIGDSYAGSGRGKGDINKKGIQQKASYVGDFIKPYRLNGYKNKDLIGIPWMLAFALRADGWYLRQDIIWAKPNPMPESIKDRCTKSHEHIFLLTKSLKYHFDYEAIQTETTGNEHDKRARTGRKTFPTALINGIRNSGYYPKANKRDVWTAAAGIQTNRVFNRLRNQLAFSTETRSNPGTRTNEYGFFKRNRYTFLKVK
jgi:DNA modification methylase